MKIPLLHLVSASAPFWLGVVKGISFTCPKGVGFCSRWRRLQVYYLLAAPLACALVSLFHCLGPPPTS